MTIERNPYKSIGYDDGLYITGQAKVSGFGASLHLLKYYLPRLGISYKAVHA